MKCTICSTEKDVRKIKHLPLTAGRSGHVTLTDWTPYCSSCAIEQGNLYCKQMDELMKSRQ